MPSTPSFAPSPFFPYKYRQTPLTTIHSRLPLLPSIAPPPNFSSHRYRLPSLLPHIMAAVSGLVPPRHPSPFRKAQKISRPSATTTAHGPTSVRRLSNSNLKHSHALVAAVGREWKRPVSWTRANSQALCSFRFPSFCVPGCPSSPGTALHYPYPPIGPLYCLRPSSDAAPPIGDLRRSLSSPTFEGSVSRG